MLLNPVGHVSVESLLVVRSFLSRRFCETVASPWHSNLRTDSRPRFLVEAHGQCVFWVFLKLLEGGLIVSDSDKVWVNAGLEGLREVFRSIVFGNKRVSMLVSLIPRTTSHVGHALGWTFR